MRDRVVQAYALGIVTGSFLAAGIFFAAPSKADITSADTNYYADAVCATLDEYPTFDGLLGIGQALYEEGYTYRDSGAIIASSVAKSCREYIPLLKRFVSRYGGTEQKIA